MEATMIAMEPRMEKTTDVGGRVQMPTMMGTRMKAVEDWTAMTQTQTFILLLWSIATESIMIAMERATRVGLIQF
jgi:hypothetical protein